MAESAGMTGPERRPTEANAEMDSAGDAAENPELLREEIARTRTEMGHTIQELKERLNRQNLMERADTLKDQAVEAAKEATVGRAEEVVSDAGQTVRGIASRVIDTIKAHPIPAVLAAALLGFLAYRLRSH